MEVSAEKKAHRVGKVKDKRQCVLDCGGFLERGWMCRLFCSARCHAVIYLKWLRALLGTLDFFEHRVGDMGP